jgi:hypothetical protein
MKHLKQLVSLTVAALALLASGSAAAQTMCVIACPANVTLATAPGEGKVYYSYSVSSSGTCGGVVQTAGLPSGAAFYPGTTTNAWRAIDEPSQTCQFTVTVTATPAVAKSAEPIPLLGPLGLGLLAAALAGGGAFAARRRSTRR